ncbi:condensin complex protein MksE [Candidatus Sulfurimonas baltica]|uniref:Uncharacterized protein n=1 Tax=Candidatus Sulfurimonas baltica TaxID=2740404 RepID=A0A7S7RN98_9BACT|nr:hypothetical protein [Candidatus Sulfurimonas baltica]QOY52198.1 hypothetical protein HUE88_00420 [Candidatus Sulfurimonas baltica]
MTSKLDKQLTAKIFNHLKDGKFLSQNTPDKNEKKLYTYVENNSDEIIELFLYLDIDLKIKNGYCYFASLDNKEQKIQSIYELIDLLSFFYNFNPIFGVGFKFSINDIEERVKDDITLKVKLDRIKSLSGDTLRANLLSLTSKLEKRGFLTLEDEYLQRYIVLNSCDYLIDFFNKIEIKE